MSIFVANGYGGVVSIPTFFLLIPTNRYVYSAVVS